MLLFIEFPNRRYDIAPGAKQAFRVLREGFIGESTTINVVNVVKFTRNDCETKKLNIYFNNNTNNTQNATEIVILTYFLLLFLFEIITVCVRMETTEFFLSGSFCLILQI